jgi:hypothetical protein
MPNSAPASISAFHTFSVVGHVGGDVNLEAVFAGVAGARDQHVGTPATSPQVNQ